MTEDESASIKITNPTEDERVKARKAMLDMLLGMDGIDKDIGARELHITGKGIDGGILYVLTVKEGEEGGRYIGFLTANNMRPAVGMVISGRYDTMEEIKGYTKGELKGFGVRKIKFKETTH